MLRKGILNNISSFSLQAECISQPHRPAKLDSTPLRDLLINVGDNGAEKQFGQQQEKKFFPQQTIAVQ